MLGGVIWLLAWAHFLLTHGPTTSDYKETFLGLSYYDSTKLTVFAIVLCIVGILSLWTRRPMEAQTWTWTLGRLLAVSALSIMSAGRAVTLRLPLFYRNESYAAVVWIQAKQW